MEQARLKELNGKLVIKGGELQQSMRANNQQFEAQIKTTGGGWRACGLQSSR